jgi:ABC-type glycerol-3-phosphate transport system substrate-binding protein
MLAGKTPRLTRRRFLGELGAVGALIAVGCRPAAPVGPPPQLTVWAASHPVAAVQQLISQQSAAAAGEAGVRLDFQSDSLGNLRAKLPGAIAARQFPDVALLSTLDGAGLAARGVLADVRSSLDRIAGLNGDLFPPLATLAAAGPFVDSRPSQLPPVWAVPYLGLGVAWLIRKDFFAQKQVPTPKTFDDAQAAAQKLNDSAGGVAGWGASLPLDDALDGFGLAAFLGYGAIFFDPNGLRVTLSPTDGVAPLQALGHLYQTDNGVSLTPEGVADWSAADLAAGFARGAIAQTLDFGGLYGQVVAASPKLREAIQVLPFPAGSKAQFNVTPTSAFVLARGAHLDRATAFVERLLRPERFDALSRVGVGAVIPPYAYQTKGPLWDDDPNYAAFVTSNRGDPARNLQWVPFGYPSPPTLPVLQIALAHLLAQAVRSVVVDHQDPSAVAVGLRASCQAVFRAGYALQPATTPTPLPSWLQAVSTAVAR